MQLGPIMRMPASRTRSSSSVLRGAALGACLGKARRECKQPVPPTLAAMAESTTAGTRAAGDHHDGEIDGAWHVLQSRIRRHAVARLRPCGLIGSASPVNRARRLPKTAAPMSRR